MRGASADSLASLLDALGSAVDAGADANRVAEDLFGVAAILRREPGLRRIATDVSVASRAKQELMRQVFGEQLDATSLDLVAQGAGRRWAGSRDLADALEHVGIVAVVRAAGRAGTADRLEDELFAFEQALTDNPSLRDALSDPARSTTDKRALLRSLLEGKVTGETIRLAEQAVSGSHRTVNVAVQEYQKVAARHRQRVVATVHVARELSERDAERLSSALAAQYERPVHLNTVVDPDVIGGLRVEVGDEVIDGTVASRLAEARRRLAG